MPLTPADSVELAAALPLTLDLEPYRLWIQACVGLTLAAGASRS